LLFSFSVEAKDAKLSERVAALEEQTAFLAGEIALLNERVSELEPDGFDEFKERLSNLESAFGPWETTVDCGAGERLQDVLDEASTRVGPVIITVEGMCSEEVVIRRDDVSLIGGSSPESGIQDPSDPSGNHVPLILEGAQRVYLVNIKLIDGEVGLQARTGASFTAFNLQVAGASRAGIEVIQNASGEIWTLTVNDLPDHSYGVWVWSGGVLGVANGTISDETVGNGTIGAGVFPGAMLQLEDVTIERLNLGLEVHRGGTASFQGGGIEYGGSTGEIFGSITVGGSEMTGNTWGLYVKPGGVATIVGSVIQDIYGEGNSSIQTQETITGSVSVGADTSLVFLSGTDVTGRVTLGGTSVLEAYPTADPASIQIDELYCNEDIVTQVMLEGDVQIGAIVGCRGYP
jgi:hypothetical protein